MSQIDTRILALGKAPMGEAGQRVLAELVFARQLSLHKGHCFETEITQAIAILEDGLASQGALTTMAAQAAEQALLPLAAEAKRYQVLMVGHAHIDMNWMWRYDETVSITLETFRTALKLMEEFPDFTFAQSQASTYEIVEKYEPAMLPRIRDAIRRGQWEVSASTWVEADRNLPSGESVARQELYTRRYLARLLEIDENSLDLDFEPDTFGHAANTPELLAQAGVKYYYHCRGNDEDILYRWQAPSGAEVLVYREPTWYLGPIQWDFAKVAPDICEKTGLDTLLWVYGVGDHGGGPTRRDLLRIKKMMDWPVYPQIRFGTYREFFARAEAVRASLPVVCRELNPVFTGCYTTQTRIKRANRIGEATLYQAEAFQALASVYTGTPATSLEEAWRRILFNQFHDIIPGSGVADTREYALGIFQQALSQANSAQASALRAVAERIDTGDVPEDANEETGSEGAGVGFGVETFHLAAVERGRGHRRVITAFNPCAFARTEVVELTLWDWDANEKRLRLTDDQGQPVPVQVISAGHNAYWQHDYTQIAARVTLPAVGYASFVLDLAEDDMPLGYPLDPRVDRDPDFRLENSRVLACFDPSTGALIRLLDKASGRELVDQPTALFAYVLEQANDMSAWRMEREIECRPLTRPVSIQYTQKGALLQAIRMVFPLEDSRVTCEIRLKEESSLLEYRTEVDWRFVGDPVKGIPSLRFLLPFGGQEGETLFDIPAGTIRRAFSSMDRPALTFAAAPLGENRAMMLTSDSKYGLRSEASGFSMTLIRSSYNPDPNPENGIHRFRIGFGPAPLEPEALARLSQAFAMEPAAMSTRPHKGDLPRTGSLLAVEGAVVQAIKPAEDGDGIILRIFNPTDREITARIGWKGSFSRVDTHELPCSGAAGAQMPMKPMEVAALRLK